MESTISFELEKPMDLSNQPPRSTQDAVIDPQTSVGPSKGKVHP